MPILYRADDIADDEISVGLYQSQMRKTMVTKTS